ncbi:MAG TPA: endonuclease [Alcanivoracaceae bacterium]|nr:endonuclease [Alcanivoracaceae bacterium]
MHIKFRSFFVVLTLIFLAFTHTATAQQQGPLGFAQAKKELRQQVYYDRHTKGDSYCGCTWKWVGVSGGRTDLASCGYEIRAQKVRAERIEWEHVVPAWQFGHQRQCWQQGGRKHCKRTDPVFNMMEADMHNLTPVVGEVNADRSNYAFGALPNAPALYGACTFRVDFSARKAMPPESFRGAAARIYFYMADRYDLTLSRQQQQLFMAWHRQHPATDWEIERDRRIAAVMGHHNPFVTGERVWKLGHKNSREGLHSKVPATHPSQTNTAGPIHGNRNSRVYHLPKGCPSYNAMKDSNKIEFKTEAEAQAAGFRKAGNCR